MAQKAKSPQKAKWQKNLYSNVGYPDNYTDESFLRDLRRNVNLKHYTYFEALRGATYLTNQISCITSFLLNFYFMFKEEVSPTNALLFNGSITFVAYIMFKWQNLNIHDLMESSKTLLTVLIFGFIFSPLLHTLTDAISTDTIYSMTFFMMFLNAIFYDYGLKSALVSKPISLNAAIFGSICLASRLSSPYHAFALLVIAAVYFVLYPIFSKRFWRWYFLIPIVFGCCIFLRMVSLPVLYTYVCIVVFINLACPWAFVRLQCHKNNIYGPWDEAVVQSDIKLEEKKL